MSYAAAISGGGYAGWLLLKRSQAVQQSTQGNTPAVKRATEYFRENIGKVVFADDLVNDRRLLQVATTAFGLEDDLNAKAFIRKIISDGTTASSALANRLADKRYLAFAKTFNLDGTEAPNTLVTGFAELIIAQYNARRFEADVGESNPAYRLALNAEREVAALAAAPNSSDTKWFSVMGNKPLRQVFETAFGLPASFGTQDIDQQLKALKARSQKIIGTSDFSKFAEPENIEKLIRNYILRDAVQANGTMSPAQNALQLLSGSRR